MLNRYMLILLAAGLLNACGGGGGGGSPAPAPVAPAPVNTTNAGPVTSQSSVSTPVQPAGGIQRDTANNGRPFVFASNAGMRSQVVAAVTGNPLEQDLVQCTVTLREGQECSLNRLPLLGLESSNPNIDAVMGRVLVSHPWMATRFREILNDMPPDMLLLMRALSAIVISFDVRPSFYALRTGAIYLDPEGMWLTPAEQAVIDTAPDFRSSFGEDLQFTMLWRYVLNNVDANRPPTSGTRTLSDIRYRVASLLYHELAHANDFFPPVTLSTLNRGVPVFAASPLTIPSDRLTGTFPLTSSTMFAVAQVSFQGVAPTVAQRSLSPADIAFAFTGDSASDYYNYSTRREDLAMVFEEAMMLYSFGVDRDVAVTNLPAERVCENFLVEFGVRNRVVSPSVRVRANFAVAELLPEIADQVELRLAAEDLPTAMNQGVDWCTNRELDTVSNARSQVSAQQQPQHQHNQSPERIVPYL